MWSHLTSRTYGQPIANSHLRRCFEAKPRICRGDKRLKIIDAPAEDKLCICLGYNIAVIPFIEDIGLSYIHCSVSGARRERWEVR